MVEYWEIKKLVERFHEQHK
jgi:hypothetical protein